MTTADFEAPSPTVYRPKEIAAKLDLPSEQAVWRLCQRGAIPGATKLGNRWIISREKFDAFIAGKQAA